MGEFCGGGFFPKKLANVLSELRESFDYACNTESAVWDFAISIGRLFELGSNESDLRWLVKKGYVEHGIEVTLRGDNGRQYRSIGNLTFSRRTCFVLTVDGAAVVNSIGANRVTELLKLKCITNEIAETFASQHNIRPTWDADMRKLSLNGFLVKRFKWPAPNQEVVLSAFQEEGWPERIDDPLSPDNLDQDAKRRLADTIKCLNRKQASQLLHFHGDGSGEGVFWEMANVGNASYDK